MPSPPVRPGACLPVVGLALLMGAGCVEKNPDAPMKGRKPLSRAEKRRVAKHILKAPPQALRYKVGGELEDKVVYLGLHTPQASVVPGKPFTVIHYWQVKKAMPGWKLFTHTNGPKLSDFRNFDHVPVFGLHPVTKWQPGQIVEDRHTITLPPQTKYTQVDLYVGIWQGAKRLRVRKGKQDGKNRLLAARIPVGRGGVRPRPKRHPLPVYAVRRAQGRITIDGKADEKDWKAAAPTAPWPGSLKGEAGGPRTVARMLWDDRFLYVFFEAADDDVWATVKKNDDPKLWTEQAFEIFLDADGNGATYVGLQVNPRGAIFDAYLPRPGQAQADWQSGLKAKVVVDGTLDKRDDTDRGWRVEMAIPWKAAQGRDTAKLTLPPKPGDKWRANLFRTDRPKQGALRAWAWSPPRRSTFHAPDRFGTLVFQGAVTTAPPKRPAAKRPAAMRPAAMRPAAMRPAGGMK